MTSVAEEVRLMVAGRLGFDLSQINDGSLLREDLKADSLDEVELLLDVEDFFGIRVDDDDAQKVKTVGDIVRHVSAALGEETV